LHYHSQLQNADLNAKMGAFLLLVVPLCPVAGYTNDLNNGSVPGKINPVSHTGKVKQADVH